MYNHIWKKYLPFINIQLKRSAGGEQVIDLNRVDFVRAGTGRKAGYKFTIEFTEGRVSNVISSSALASNLAAVMLESEATKQILRKGNYSISLNTKFQLITKNLSSLVLPETDILKDEPKKELANSE
jgi:hypothetical protein